MGRARKCNCGECKLCKRREAQARYNEKSGWMGNRYIEIEKLLTLLKSSGCVNCGESDARCLDLHHVDSSQKKFNVSMGSYTRKKSSLIDEASKCVVLCSNCHRKLGPH